jgi:glucosamine--fructose-6-phosphate aminotransferase (isomerizing)
VLAVAATKSVVCSIVAGARLAEYWGATTSNLNNLPEQIKSVQNLPGETLTELFVATGPILIIGRGSGYGIACEIALKLRELLGRAAMAYSSSEVLHGPAGMITSGYSVLALAVGPECNDVLHCVDKVAAMGAECHVIDNSLRQDKLAATLMLCHIYLAIEQACLQRGLSPDTPRNLSKVTLT